ncbi:MAG: macro domain-containing protein [Anaerolineae bacterium]|jgi:O-acetyl-ADP-ribose deacetylase (regulator of RNase III)|nr:macro domain-containing protein [Anaerolineae bacterium]
MITYVVGDLFQSSAKVLVNPVNTVGIMGKGIAYEFKRLYPDMFVRYQALCEKKQFHVGQLWLYKTPNRWILNFPTKEHWRNRSQTTYLEMGLQKFAQTYEQRGITSIAFPMLGCGNGELNWEDQVKPLMEKYLNPLPILIYVHLYRRKSVITPEHRDLEQTESWLREEPRTLSFEEMWQDLIKLIKEKPFFQTFDKTSVKFIAEFVQEDGIKIKSDDEEIALFHKEDLMELWHYLRTTDYAKARYFPEGLDVFSTYLIALFADLPYIQPIMISKEEPDDDDWVLQLLDHPKSYISDPIELNQII